MMNEMIRGRQLPKALIALKKFDQIVGAGWYSESFELFITENTMILEGYSRDIDFLTSFIVFARADAGGSLYAFWLYDSRLSLEKCPVVAFGNEGGYHVVASSFNQFIELLAYDAELTIDWDEAYFYKNKTDTYSEFHSKYMEWLSSITQKKSVEKPDEIIARAQLVFKEKFDSWMNKYLSS